MKTKVFLIVIGIGLLFSVRAGDSRFQRIENDSPVQADSQRYVPNMLLAKPKLRLLNLAAMQGTLLRQFPREIKSAFYDDRVGYEVIELTPGQSAEEAKTQLQKSGVFSEVWFNYKVRITETTPNDEYFKYQYPLKNTGQFVDSNKTYSGATGADIKATDGWDWATGSESLVIAVIDTGVAVGHEDLQNKIVSGYNFIDNSTQTQDDNGHGTFVASVAAAETNNSKGMAGICWKAKIMPLKTMDSKGDGDYLSTGSGDPLRRRTRRQGAQHEPGRQRRHAVPEGGLPIRGEQGVRSGRFHRKRPRPSAFSGRLRRLLPGRRGDRRQ